MALDTGGPDAARHWIERAEPTHPSLIDVEHVLDALFGVVNVPSGIWIDEDATIVRPPEPAFPRRSRLAEMPVPDDLDPLLRDMLVESKKIRTEPERYLTALRDWVGRGPESVYALAPDEVVRRSRPRPPEESLAAAHFTLGQHLHRAGHPTDAVSHFREAHRLHPGNWTYKRQAWQFVHPFQGPNDVYEGDWLSDVKAVGAENYYPSLDMP